LIDFDQCIVRQRRKTPENHLRQNAIFANHLNMIPSFKSPAQK